ncbi:MAG TPA: LysE family transporter [Bacillota bacterium]|jgi:threonine/homoserine/homoserine lactone efflux protein
MTVTTLFLTAFVVGLSGALMPGPLLTVTIRQVAERGFWAGPRAVAGHGLVELAVVVALSFGLGSYLAHPSVTGGIGIVGGVVLVWMAWETLRSSGRVAARLGAMRGTAGSEPAEPTAGSRGRLSDPVLAGLAASVSNPYWVLWWATIGASYIALSLKLGALAVAAFYVGHILSDLAWLASVSGAVAGGRRLLGPAIFRGLLVVCGLFLAGLGGYFALSGVRLLIPR